MEKKLRPTEKCLEMASDLKSIWLELTIYVLQSMAAWVAYVKQAY
jgi:hypothetical protein